MESSVAYVELNGKFEQIMQNINTVKDKQDEMAEDIAKIKEAVYHPDQGIYARIRELESWKTSMTRLIWLITTSIIGMGTALVFKYMNII